MRWSCGKAQFMILLIAQNQNIQVPFILVPAAWWIFDRLVLAVPVRVHRTDQRTCPLHNLCLRDIDPIEIIMLAASSIKVKFID